MMIAIVVLGVAILFVIAGLYFTVSGRRNEEQGAVGAGISLVALGALFAIYGLVSSSRMFG
jgi:hypothetical protein